MRPPAIHELGGGFDASASEPRAILAMIEYIHNNPLRRELALRAEDWQKSSAGWILGRNSLAPNPVDFGGLTGFCRGKE
jgi:putative transposase